MIDTEKFYVEDVLKAGYNLEPLTCKFCGHDNVIFHQYIGDGYCEWCGKWQLERKEVIISEENKSIPTNER